MPSDLVYLHDRWSKTPPDDLRAEALFALRVCGERAYDRKEAMDRERHWTRFSAWLADHDPETLEWVKAKIQAEREAAKKARELP